MDLTDIEGRERFQTGAAKYASYLQTPEGRLRLELAFANLQDFLPPTTHHLLGLDIGGGTGAIAVRLARLGIHFTLLDSSQPMLDLAQRAAREEGIAEKIALQHGDASLLAKFFPPGSFDLVLCHDVLEYVENPGAVLSAAARLMRDSSSVISVLVRNQAGEVLKAALRSGDLAAAETNLSAEWGEESLYKGKVRLFTPKTLEAMLQDASLTPFARSGVRCIADYLPPQISRSAEYERIFSLERKLGARPEFFGVARYIQVLARSSAAQSEVAG
jgi:S-adenosylmethionine-dependent methyltransferase